MLEVYGFSFINLRIVRGWAFEILRFSIKLSWQSNFGGFIAIYSDSLLARTLKACYFSNSDVWFFTLAMIGVAFEAPARCWLMVFGEEWVILKALECGRTLGLMEQGFAVLLPLRVRDMEVDITVDKLIDH